MKITLTIDADIEAEEIIALMEAEAKLENERAERFSNGMTPSIFGTTASDHAEEIVSNLINKTKKDKPN